MALNMMDGSNTVLADAFSDERLEVIHDEQHFGLDINSAVSTLKEEFSKAGIKKFDANKWASETSRLMRKGSDIIPQDAKAIVYGALIECGFSEEQLEADRGIVDRIVASYGINLE